MTAEDLKNAAVTLASLARVAEEHGDYERAWALQPISEDYEAELAAGTLESASEARSE